MKRYAPWFIGFLAICTLLSLRHNLSLRDRLTEARAQLKSADVLRTEIESLRRQQHSHTIRVAEIGLLRKQAAEVHRLRGQAAEALRLQSEIDQLRSQLEENEQLIESLEVQLSQLSLPPAAEPPSETTTFSQLTPSDSPSDDNAQTFSDDGLVYHARFSPDGRYVLTATPDGTALIWDAATAEPLPHGIDSEP